MFYTVVDEWQTSEGEPRRFSATTTFTLIHFVLLLSF